MSAVLDIKSGAKVAATALQIASYNELDRNGISEGFTFDEEQHLFTYQDKTVPSTTRILKDMGLYPDYSFVDPYYLTRGSYVHKGTEYFDRGTLDESSLDPEIAPYVEQYTIVKPHFPFEIVGIEVKKVHAQLWYAGIIDRVITGHTNYVLYLTKTSFKLEAVENIRNNFNIFQSALNVYQWRKQNLKEGV